MFIQVLKFNPLWKTQFVAESGVVRTILGSELINVFHIGGTAVEEMQARPVIDMLAVVNGLARVDVLESRFAGMGFECLGEFGAPGRRFFTKGDDKPTLHLYVYPFDNQQDIERHLAVREYLRANPQPRLAFGTLKNALAQQFPYDLVGYNKGKKAFISAIEKDALRWRYRTLS